MNDFHYLISQANKLDKAPLINAKYPLNFKNNVYICNL